MQNGEHQIILWAIGIINSIVIVAGGLVARRLFKEIDDLSRSTVKKFENWGKQCAAHNKETQEHGKAIAAYEAWSEEAQRGLLEDISEIKQRVDGLYNRLVNGSG